ncbi:MAG: FtsX-like permease family protein, partial [Acutalibacter sp.]|nr:FtsX-like permease family protein [Acutalibacter sp.]
YYTYMGSKKSGAIFLPNVIWPSMFAYDEPEEVAVRVSYTEAMSKVGKDVADLLNTYNTNTNIVYQAEDTLKQAKELQDLSNATNQQLVWIASISLLVGGIGVMNIMLVSVTERTREIGLKKAIGAKKSRILWQFLTEAALLTSLGGLLGVGVGIGLAELISHIAETPVAISVPAILFGVLFSMVIGIIFGLMPSVKAANLNPIDALRHE